MMAKAVSKHGVRPHLVKQLRRAGKGARLMVSLLRQGDTGALHDIRVQARTMASVLQPFLELPHMKPVRRRLEPLKSWMRKSNRVRDAEAQLELIEELLPESYPRDAQRHIAKISGELVRRRGAMAQSTGLIKLPRRIERLAEAADVSLDHFSPTELIAVVAHAGESLVSELRNDCAAGLQDARQWHQARLRIKRLRYLSDYFRDFLDPRFQEIATDTKLAQQNLGRLRDWQNLRAAMADVPAMAQWLAGHAELEAELTRQAEAAMASLAHKLAAQG